MATRFLRTTFLLVCLLAGLGLGRAALAGEDRLVQEAKPANGTPATAPIVVWGSRPGGVPASGFVPATAGATAAAATPRDAAAIIMSQGFEGTWPANGWGLRDSSTTDGGEFLLGKRNCDPRTGSFGGWMVGGGAQGSNLPCGSNYPNNISTIAEFGPIDLSAATSAELVFYAKGTTELYEGDEDCFYDYLFVSAATTGNPYLDGGVLCGPITGTAGNGYFGPLILDLSAFLGQPEVWIAFYMRSDDSVTFNGVTIDDIALDVTGGGCAVPAAPGLGSPSDGASLTDTTPAFSWSSVANANEYELEVDNNSDFSSPIIDRTGPQTSFTPGSPLAQGTYFWRVGANNTTGGCEEFGPWSAARSFTITGTLTCFTLALDHTGQGANPTPSPGSSAGCGAGQYTAGQVINLTAAPSAGWRVGNWAGTNANGSTSTSNTVTMPAGNHTARVNYVPNNSGARAFLPSVTWISANFLGPFEVEPNNSLEQANGPILLARNYQGFPNDRDDWFFFDVPSARALDITVNNVTGTDPQVQLYNGPGSRVGFDATPPYRITYQAQPGRYWIRVVVVSGNNSTTPYTLRVN